MTRTTSPPRAAEPTSAVVVDDPRLLTGSRRGFGLALLVLAAALTLAGCSEPPRSRVLVLGLDGLDPATVDQMISEGALPNLRKLRREGAYGRLESAEPLLSPIIWTSIATGKKPDQHGIGHFVATGPNGENVPVSSDMRKVKALWNIASELERSVAVVGWWATWPPEEVDGSIVSDRVAYHFLFQDGLSGGAASASETYPPQLARRIGPLLERPRDLSAADLERYATITQDELEQSWGSGSDLEHLAWAVATAESYKSIGLELWRQDRPDLALVYVEATDSTAHLFGHLFRAEGLAGELAEQQRRFGKVVEEMYRRADEIVGEYLEALDENSTLVVISDHGFELGVLHDDPSKTRDLRRVSERYHRLHGVLYAYGRGVKAGGRFDDATIFDLTPTFLALLGAPPAADMPGRVLSEGFEIPLPRQRIASYDSPGGRAPASSVERDSTLDEAMIARLESLGYLGGSPPEASEPEGSADDAHESTPSSADSTNARNLAAIAFEAGRYEEALAAYRELSAQSPDDGSLHTSLAGVLGALGRFDEAATELDTALALDPLDIEAYHNRAVIAERRGRREAAVELYRTALRYDPSYAPSRAALERLTGSAATSNPKDANERRAAALADQASEAAKRGDYLGAMELLDQAEAAAPDYALVHQYRANVSYLRGDPEGAIKALERALELEPDNALYRENLRRLRSSQAPGER